MLGGPMSAHLRQQKLPRLWPSEFKSQWRPKFFANLCLKIIKINNVFWKSINLCCPDLSSWACGKLELCGLPNHFQTRFCFQYRTRHDSHRRRQVAGPLHRVVPLHGRSNWRLFLPGLNGLSTEHLITKIISNLDLMELGRGDEMRCR